MMNEDGGEKSKGIKDVFLLLLINPSMPRGTEDTSQGTSPPFPIFQF